MPQAPQIVPSRFGSFGSVSFGGISVFFCSIKKLGIEAFIPNSHRQQSGCFFFRVFNTCQEDMFSFGGSHESYQDFQFFFQKRLMELMRGFVPFDLHLGSLGPCY